MFATARRQWPKVATATVALGAGVYAYDRTHYSVVSRAVRAMWTLSFVAYKYTRCNYADMKEMEQVHEQCAESLLQMLQKNKGLFIKIGQAIANQGPLFPMAYQKRFAQLYDAAPADDWKEIEAMLNRVYGTSNWGFTIDSDAVASASIAQVYKGHLPTGEAVAVKVQHPSIEYQLHADLWVYQNISKVYSWVFGLPFSMFTKYISSQMVQETDFGREAANGERLLAALIADGFNNRVHVPKVYPQVSKKQVLVTEWIDGTSLTETEKISANFNTHDVLHTFLDVFGRQIFRYGFVHCDPHPGNLMVRRTKWGQQQLVILDHGLYIDLPRDFEQQYSRLWQYMFTQDTTHLKEIAQSWGIDSVDIFASLVSLKPTYMTSNPPPKATQLDDDRDIQTLLGQFLKDESKFPLQLIFLTRTMRMMQNMNKQYGSPVNRINVLTRSAVAGANLGWSQRLRVSFALWVSDIVFLFVRFKQWLLGDLWGRPSLGIEDYMELFIKNTAKQHGIDFDL
ncbi:hypothetical protein DIURU_002905 [Diutina rugosa]|uniref:ABC1 atypical kinase-like domain-containing protein n=1 Tax=Diutina rugosa TaxID=5481 RepID=A0A642UNW0_DIURU|nr:uncharacterized protein DIURU_002905 [Diutina rugosa]KAA8902451.1 hypothetical protein DIURU_002905 [Diutina rugosa]